jgi:thymidylate kinase
VIIVFSGVDCSGKSTQINILKDRVAQKKLSVYSIWSRGGYTARFEKIKKVLRFILGKKSIPSGRSKKRDKVMSNPRIVRLWLIIAMFDLFFLYAITLRFKSFNGNVVICDRYLGDTFIDFSLNFPSINFEKMWLWKLLLVSLPKPDVGFLFTLPAEESISRSKLKNEPFPDSKEVLEYRLKMYEASMLFNGENWSKINGLDSINLSAKTIEKKVFSKFTASDAT